MLTPRAAVPPAQDRHCHHPLCSCGLSRCDRGRGFVTAPDICSEKASSPCSLNPNVTGLPTAGTHPDTVTCPDASADIALIPSTSWIPLVLCISNPSDFPPPFLPRWRGQRRRFCWRGEPSGAGQAQPCSPPTHPPAPCSSRAAALLHACSSLPARKTQITSTSPKRGQKRSKKPCHCPSDGSRTRLCCRHQVTALPQPLLCGFRAFLQAQPPRLPPQLRASGAKGQIKIGAGTVLTAGGLPLGCLSLGSCGSAKPGSGRSPGTQAAEVSSVGELAQTISHNFFFAVRLALLVCDSLPRQQKGGRARPELLSRFCCSAKKKKKRQDQ